MDKECDTVDCIDDGAEGELDDGELVPQPVEPVKPVKTYVCDFVHYTEGITECPLMARTMKGYDDKSFDKAPKCSASCHSCRTIHLLSKSLHNSRLEFCTTAPDTHSVQFELKTQHDVNLRLQLGENPHTVAMFVAVDVPFVPSDATMAVLDGVLSRMQNISSDYMKVDATIAKEVGFVGITGKRPRGPRGTTYDEANSKAPTRKKLAAALTEPHGADLKPAEKRGTTLKPAKLEEHATTLKPAELEQHEAVLTPRWRKCQDNADAEMAAQVQARDELERTKTIADGSAPGDSYPALQPQPKPAPVPAAVGVAELREKAKAAKAQKLSADKSQEADEVTVVRETVRKGRGFRSEFTASDKPNSAPHGYSARELAADKARADAQQKIWVVKKEPTS